MERKYSKDYYQKSCDYILSKVDFKPEIALILGSSLGPLADQIENKVVIDYKDIPNFLLSTVESHAGKLILGKLEGKSVVCMSGRFHYYEGYDFEQLVTPIRVFKLLGVESVILTNAAGSVNEDYKVGDIMIIEDHIKLMGASPLRGPNQEEFGPRFNNMSNVYSPEYVKLAEKIAEENRIPYRKGVYFYMPGPQFETPAEIRAIRALGGDAVGMSTVTETITAAHANMKVVGLSLMTNYAAGVNKENANVNSEEVDLAAEEAGSRFRKLIKELVKNM